MSYTTGALVDARNNNGWTALMEASSAGDGNLVQILLEAGENICKEETALTNRRSLAKDPIQLVLNAQAFCSLVPPISKCALPFSFPPPAI